VRTLWLCVCRWNQKGALHSTGAPFDPCPPISAPQCPALAEYLLCGLDGLRPRTAPGATPKLRPDLAAEIRRWVIAGPQAQGLDRANWTYADLATHLYQTHGITIRKSAMQVFCRRHGIRPYRPTYRFLRGDPAKQAVARAEQLVLSPDDAAPHPESPGGLLSLGSRADSFNRLMNEMGIALDHRQGSVAKDLRNLSETCPVHGQITGGTMSEIMEAEVGNFCLFECRFPRLAWIQRVCPLGTGKDQGRIDPSPPSMLTHLL
jgi:hypothetical protein